MRYTLRHLLRHWRLNLVLLLGLTFAAALLAGLPSYAQGSAAETLKSQLAAQPVPGRNIEINGDPGHLTGALYGQVARELGDLVVMRVQLNTFAFKIELNKPPESVDGGQRTKLNYYNIWSMDRARELLRVVEGSWPEYEPPHTPAEIAAAMTTPPPVDVAIPSMAAEQSGYQIGDRLFGEDGYTFDIVGIVEPLDPNADVWWGEPSFFNMMVYPGRDEDTVVLPLVVSQFGMQSGLGWHAPVWRVLVDQSQITPENAADIQARLQRLNTLVTSEGTVLSSNLPGILQAYLESLATLRMVLLLLGVQAFLFILYALGLVTSVGMESLHSEMALLAGRGASMLQILSTYLLEGLLLALLAGALLGPLLAQGFLLGWGRLAGVSLPESLPRDSRLLALAGAGLGWLVLSLSVIPAARRSVLEWQLRRGRPEQLAAWQRRGVDVFLLLLGGVAYWQLGTSGSFILNRLRQVDLTDPLLLLGPTLFMLALAMLALRLFPYLFQAMAWLARHSRGLVLPLGLARLARAPVRPAQVILLISLAAGLILFSSAYTYSLERAQTALALYRAGTDLRVYPAEHTLEEFAALPGVQALSMMQRIPVNSARGGTINVLAVDPATLAGVTDYPPGMTTLTIPTVLGAVAWQTPETPVEGGTVNPYTETSNRDNPIPAVFSAGALAENQELGSIVQLLFPSTRLDFKVSGILSNFPTGQGNFIILDRAALMQYIDLEASQYARWKEVWMRIDPGYYSLLESMPWVRDGLRADSRQKLLELEANPFLQGTRRAFALNSVIVSILSVAGLFLVHYFSARQRTYEFGVLRAEGMSAGQVLLLLAGEALLSALIGLGVGVLLGLGLSEGMRAYLNLILGRVEGGLSLYQVRVDWLTVLRQAGLLVGGYLLATLISLGMLMRSGVHRVLRIGDE